MVAELVTPRTNNPNGRPSNALLQERLGRARQVNTVLRTENHSLLAEVARLGAELIAIGSRLDMALTADRPDLALHFAGRIDSLGRSCQRRGGAA
jgi:hypothetical protein